MASSSNLFSFSRLFEGLYMFYGEVHTPHALGNASPECGRKNIDPKFRKDVCHSKVSTIFFFLRLCERGKINLDWAVQPDSVASLAKLSNGVFKPVENEFFSRWRPHECSFKTAATGILNS